MQPNISDESFKDISKQTVKTYIDARDEQNKRAQLIFGITMAFMLFFAASEGIKVIFRKNFGLYGLNILKIIVCSICFILLGTLSFFAINSDDDSLRDSGTSDSHLATAILFVTIGITILVNGIKEKRKAEQNKRFTDYEGESVLLGFLKKEVSEKIIRNLFEPLTVLAIGISFCFFDWIAGITMIFCAISVWVLLFYKPLLNKVFVGSPADRVNNLNKSINQQQGFNEVKID